MDKIIAYCGLNCGACHGYLATQADDEAWKERVAAAWREEYKNPAVDTAYVTCDACNSTTGRLGGHCAECGVRICAVERGVISCAHCSDYLSCQTIQEFIQFVPSARANLEEIYRGLEH